MKNTILITLAMAISHFGFTQEFVEYSDNGKYGLKDDQGKIVIKALYEEPIYVDPMHYSAMSITVKKDGDYYGGYINKEGIVIIPPVYKGASVPTGAYNQMHGGYDGLCKDGKCAIFDSTGTMITPLKYDDIIDIGERTSIVKIGSKFGVVENSSGKEITEIIYHEIELGLRGDQPITLKLDSKYGLLNDSGNITDFKYDYIMPFRYDANTTEVINGGKNLDDNIIGNEEGGKWGVVDINGKEIIPVKYDKITIWSSGNIKAELNGEEFEFDKDGNPKD